MRRSDFVRAIIASTTAWPLTVRAQQPANRIPLIAAIMPLSEDDPEGQARLAAFRQALQDLG
jgi:hypothetical protein